MLYVVKNAEPLYPSNDFCENDIYSFLHDVQNLLSKIFNCGVVVDSIGSSEKVDVAKT